MRPAKRIQLRAAERRVKAMFPSAQLWANLRSQSYDVVFWKDREGFTPLSTGSYTKIGAWNAAFKKAQRIAIELFSQ